VCACDSAEEALRQVPKLEPDVVLMDIHLPNLSGIECTARLKQLLPKTPVIMLTVYADPERIFKALQAGANGYLLKRTPPPKLLEAIKDVLSGGAPMTGEIARQVVESFKPSKTAKDAAVSLTRREQEILEALSQGYSNKEIASRLNVSFDTVRTHLRHIYEKVHVNSRSGAVAWYLGDSGQSKAARD